MYKMTCDSKINLFQNNHVFTCNIVYESYMKLQFSYNVKSVQKNEHSFHVNIHTRSNKFTSEIKQDEQSYILYM